MQEQQGRALAGAAQMDLRAEDLDRFGFWLGHVCLSDQIIVVPAKVGTTGV
jgi:hypothetical protein